VHREFTFYGGARDFAAYHGPEAIVHGPAETGKSLSALWKLHLCALKYPKASIIIARKTLASTYATILQTFRQKVLGDADAWGVRVYGGEKPEWFDYPNGSRIWITGLDKSSKILSAEHDLIYVNQVEEVALGEWETLTTRTTGRAGNMPYSQTIGDMNPAWPMHWVYSRETLKLFYSSHKENPTLFDSVTGVITEQGKHTLAVLKALTGVRYDRFFLGKAARPEGMVYETWDEQVHLINEAPPGLTRFVAGQDWGYTNPGCLGVWGLDSDDNMYLVAQIYHTKRLNEWWVKRAVELNEEFGGIEVILCDPSQPEYIIAYRNAGLNARPANNIVGAGIDAVNARFKRNGMFIVRDSLRHADETLKREKKPYRVQDEITGYVWANKKAKEIPVKENDHGCDQIRYTVNYVDKIGRGQTKQPQHDPKPSFGKPQYNLRGTL